MSEPLKLYLGVDPGRDKTGAALVWEDGTLCRQEIIPTDDFTTHLKPFLPEQPLAGCILGDGTTSKTMAAQLEKAFPRLPLFTVNEYGSTQEARKLYCKLCPPRGWKRMIPVALLDPPSAVDGLAAMVLVQRYLRDKTVKSSDDKPQK